MIKDGQSLTFGIDDQWKKLLLEGLEKQIENFKQDTTNPVMAIYAAIAAWLLFDWVHKIHGKSLGFADKKKLRKKIMEECPEMGHLKTIANAGKHRGV